MAVKSGKEVYEVMVEIVDDLSLADALAFAKGLNLHTPHEHLPKGVQAGLEDLKDKLNAVAEKNESGGS